MYQRRFVVLVVVITACFSLFCIKHLLAESPVRVFLPIARSSVDPVITIRLVDRDDPFRIASATSYVSFGTSGNSQRCIVGELVHISTGFYVPTVRLKMDSSAYGSTRNTIFQEAAVQSILRQGGPGDLLPFRYCFPIQGKPNRITITWASTKAQVQGRYCRATTVSSGMENGPKVKSVGVVQNNTGVELKRFQVAFVLRSSDGSVLDVATGAMNYQEEGQLSLRPGESSPVSASPVIAESVDKVDIYAEADQVCL